MADVGAITGILGSVVAVGGLIITLVRTKHDRDIGVTTEERASRRDTIEDRDSLIDQIQEEMREMRGRVSVIEGELQVEREWNRALVDHIYRELPPPPPPRPTRV